MTVFTPFRRAQRELPRRGVLRRAPPAARAPRRPRSRLAPRRARARRRAAASRSARRARRAARAAMDAWLDGPDRPLRRAPRPRCPAAPAVLSAVPALGLHLGRASSSSARWTAAVKAPPRSSASSPGATSTPTSCSTSRATRGSSSRRATATWSGRDDPQLLERLDAAAAPATRSSTRACASSPPPAGCTTARRMVVGSFLTKDLHLDWRARRGVVRARRCSTASRRSNNGNWQWIASTGVDPAPYFRRMFNPVLQQQKFDPDGVYVRRWVPELRDVPAARLAEPWLMSAERAGRGGLHHRRATTRCPSSTTRRSGGSRSIATARRQVRLASDRSEFRPAERASARPIRRGSYAGLRALSSRL